MQTEDFTPPVEDSTDMETPSVGARLSEAAEVNPGSLAAQLREKYKNLQNQEGHYDCEIPGYNGILVARYKTVEWSLLKKLAKKVEKSRDDRKELYAHADTLVRACDEIYGKDKDGKLIPLYKVFPGLEEGVPVKYDHQLVQAFGLTAKSARDTLLQLFNNDIAVTAHHNEVAEWMQDTSPEESEDF